MASQLEESTKTAKKIATGCGILILIIVIISIASQLLKGDPEPCNPYPSVAEKKFGPLPQIELESNELDQDENPEFVIDIDELPRMAIFVNVYKTKTPRQSLLAQDEALSIAGNLGFNDSPKNLSETEVQWKEDTKTLKIDKLYETVKITTNHKKTPSITDDNNILVDQSPYISSARNIFAGTYAGSKMNDAEAEATYLKIDKKFNFVKANSASDADFVRVDFHKKLEGVTPFVPAGCTSDQKAYVEENLEDLRIYYNVNTIDPHKSDNYVILSGTSGARDILEFSYIDWDIDTSSVYETITVTEAWQQVSSGNGSLRTLYRTNVGNPFESDYTIPIEKYLLTNVEMAYYTTNEFTRYIQPLYVFSGIAQIQDTTDKYAEFTFYYPAIKY